MADLFLGDSAAPEPVSGSGVVSSMLNLAGAATSIVLIGGLALWGYQLLVRDVSGVPVVRALEGPMRIAPDEPGGEQMQHQGFAVNSIAADGVAEGPAERLVLAPEPLTLDAEDVPGLTPVPEVPEETVETLVLPEQGTEEVVEAVPSNEVVPELPEETDVVALAEKIAEGAVPLAAPAPEPALAVIPETVKGVSRSPFPAPRPLGDVTAEAVAESVVLAVTPASVEVTSIEVSPGARLVQFGAFGSPEEAREEWQRLESKFGNLSDKKRVVEKADSGGKTFYRLRAMGFADISDARRFCAAFVTEREACIPVVAQ